MTPVAIYTYEDFSVGREFPLGPQSISAEQIIAFASEFDPQPMHLSEEAGRQSILGGLAASGWHTCSLLMRMMADSYIANSTSQGSPGIDYVDWKKPVLAGDTLSGKSIVLEQRPSASRAGIGLVKFRHELYNQRGILVAQGENTVMFLMRADGGLAA
ncbi:MaoC family dehydratase [Agrobacterium genomosp. 3]|uniref:MaoC family dehydratase n=1 Tax=Agrobacterium tumefaciens TaxID=358 RepID=A0AAE6BMX6_AGRTU|nr:MULTISPECIES: MaoC family dehydratase [Agrobacterium]MCA1869076.1 MaoC family dehydratase [Agrobacterium tomkonis]MCA2378862.1 MaoC family dehydratase [Agrobacterium tomkonis RTP8]KNY35086.1 enoyl-CoA hydratase [Agrobacterium sp. SUL3]MCA1879432.1 MaoC family dehydratase [Agrobacterium tumefaciens]MCA1894651.1 MaoC family dehydratase [Agrobacterium tomkonis]